MGGIPGGVGGMGGMGGMSMGGMGGMSDMAGMGGTGMAAMVRATQQEYDDAKGYRRRAMAAAEEAEASRRRALAAADDAENALSHLNELQAAPRRGRSRSRDHGLGGRRCLRAAAHRLGYDTWFGCR